MEEKSEAGDSWLMQAETQSEPVKPARPRERVTPLLILASTFAVELFLSQLLPEDTTVRHSWEGTHWNPTPLETYLYVIVNAAIMLATARLLTSDLATRLSLPSRRVVMLGALSAACLLGAQLLRGWLLFSNEGGRDGAGGPGLPAMMAHTTILFQGAWAFATLRWMSSRLTSQGHGREAKRAGTASMALLVAIGARAMTFGTGTISPAVGLVMGLTAMIYLIYQLTWLGRPTDLLLSDRVEGKATPQL